MHRLKRQTTPEPRDTRAAPHHNTRKRGGGDGDGDGARTWEQRGREPDGIGDGTPPRAGWHGGKRLRHPRAADRAHGSCPAARTGHDYARCAAREAEDTYCTGTRYCTCTGKKTPGGAGTHTGHTGHTGARGHETDHTDDPHNHPPKPKDTNPHENRDRLNNHKNSRKPGVDRSPRPTTGYSTVLTVPYFVTPPPRVGTER